MMVTETETLTSTLHHNIFTYLDYVFLLPSYIYIYIYIYIFTYLDYVFSTTFILLDFVHIYFHTDMCNFMQLYV